VEDAVTGLPIESAEVRDSASGRRYLTDARGVVGLDSVRSLLGINLIVISKPGYAPARLRISTADTLLAIMLVPRPLGAIQELPPVVTTETAANVSPRMQEFEYRARYWSSAAKFIQAAELRQKDHSRLEDILDVHGIALRNRGCRGRPRLFLDDVLVDPREIPAYGQDYEAIEFYPSSATAPSRFAGPSDCGVLILWRRER